MAVTVVSGYNKSPMGTMPSSQIEHATSSGTTVVDEHMTLPNDDNREMIPQKTEPSPARTDVSRLSKEFEPSNPQVSNSRGSSTGAISDEADALGEYVKEVISVISRLDGLGLQRLSIPLPRCVVLGEQSAGKSSVIEAISGIRTPRSTDTCTRCPLFIKLESSSDPSATWEARISLRQSYSYDGKVRDKFPGWVPNPRSTDYFFASTNDPTSLEDLIARAQLAALSPLASPEEFLQANVYSRQPDDYLKTQFSPNVVCISVSQPDLPALSFYDLPGVIGQSESAEDHFLVKFVKDLVSDYIEDKESLVLVTCSLANDIANSTAGGIAREKQAANRCIGVLTKPDCLPPGSRSDMLRAVLDGQRFELGHGYFVVKNPGQDDLDRGLTHNNARAQEREFFATNEPWATTLHAYQHRFGTMNLQKFLGGKLAAQMLQSLPHINESINARLQGVETELQHLPETPLQNAARMISDVLYSFSDEVRNEMNAEYPFRAWRNSWEALQKAFMNGLLAMKPTMSTSGKLDVDVFKSSMPGKSVDEAYVIDSDNEDEQDTAMQDASQDSKKKRKREVTPALAPAPTSSKTPSKRFASGLVAPDAQNIRRGSAFKDYRKVFALDEVTEHLNETSKSKIPDQIQPKVIEDMILATIEHWEKPLKEFFGLLQGQLTGYMQEIFDKHFKKWNQTQLYEAAWNIVKDVLTTNFDEQWTAMAMETLNDERDGPYIFHQEMFNRERESVRDAYRQARFRAREKIYFREMAEHTGKSVTLAEKDRLSKDERKKAILMHEPYENEIAVIAKVASYYMMAARRFHDSICMRIESRLFKRLRTRLLDDLDSGLGIHDDQDGPQNAMRLLAEPIQRQNVRNNLKGMRNALLEGQQCLIDMKKKFEDAPPSSQMSNGYRTIPVFGSSFGPTSTPLTEEMEDITRSGMHRR